MARVRNGNHKHVVGRRPKNTPRPANLIVDESQLVDQATYHQGLMEHLQECWRERPKLSDLVYSEVVWCTACNGSGSINNRECPRCEGQQIDRALSLRMGEVRPS